MVTNLLMDMISKDRLSLLAAVGCGVAIGVGGLYTHYTHLSTNRQLTDQMQTLTNSIEELKKEVNDLKILSMNASAVQSQSHSPLHSRHQLFHYADSHVVVGGGNNVTEESLVQCFNDNQLLLQQQRRQHYMLNECQTDSQLTEPPLLLPPPPVDNSVSTDDNEEFFDFTEGETDNELNVSINSCNNLVKISDNNNYIKQEKKSLEEWIRYFDQLLEDSTTNKRDLYQQLVDIQLKYPNCGDLLWRLSKATYLYGVSAQKESNIELKKTLSFEALDYATKAIECDESNAECHKWYAITIGSLSDFIATKEKIANGNKFKQHLDIALALKPDDPSLYHMLGRFCFEVSQLSWVERKVASALFSKVPESSFDAAFNHFMKAHELRPDWKENILFMTNVLMSQKKFNEAIKWIDRGLGLKTVGEDDCLAHKQLDLLNSKLRKYR